MDEANPYEPPQASIEEPRRSARELKRWVSVREAGRKRYILLYGVLGWGVLTAVLWSFLTGYGEGVEQFLQRLLIALVGFPIGGYFWGAWMWKTMEKKFAEAQQSGEG